VDSVQISILVALFLLLVSSLWVLFDARRHRIPTHGYAYTTNTGAGAWFLGCLFLWYVDFPVYLVRRGKLLSQRRRRSEAVARFDELIGQAVEISPDDPALEGSDPWDVVAIGQCQRLRGLEPVHLAPEILPGLVHRALKLYLRLEPGELLLAIIDPTLGSKPGQACALTTRKIHWSDPNWKDALAKTADGGIAPGHGLGRAGQVFGGLSVPYTALRGSFTAAERSEQAAQAMCQIEPRAPETSAEASETEPAPAAQPLHLSEPAGRDNGSGLASLELADGRRINLKLLEPGLRDAICDFLRAVGPVARQGHPALGAAMADQARWMLPTLKQHSGRIFAEQEGLHDFHSALRTATRRAIVTPLLVVACVAVFAAMVVRGVSPTEPSIEALLDWGGNFGPYVAVDHEYWRLFTSMFLHVGFLHLLFNMWCLLAAGPMVERFFGNLGFAVIYVISGIGGALASTAFHPLLVSAGASGAIFGIFGALFGFLAVQHQTVPAALLKPLRASAGSFVAFNIVFGLMSPQIDNAAHLGGLATGFLCGLLLYRRLPIIPGQRGIARRVLATAGLSIGLVLAAFTVADAVAVRPQIRAASHETYRASQSYNQLATLIQKPLEDWDRVSIDMNRLLDRLGNSGSPLPDDPAVVLGLIKQLESDLETLRQAPPLDLELRAILGELIAAEADLRDALNGIKGELIAAEADLRDALNGNKSAVDHPDAPPADGPGSIAGKIEESGRAIERFSMLSEKYLKSHGLTLLNEPPKDNRLPGQASRPDARHP
jgi:rhomboid protease GluP